MTGEKGVKICKKYEIWMLKKCNKKFSSNNAVWLLTLFFFYDFVLVCVAFTAQAYFSKAIFSIVVAGVRSLEVHSPTQIAKHEWASSCEK